MLRASSPALLHLVDCALAERHAALGDGELLQRFLRQRDEAAFEAIVCRHGPMVLDVCRSLLPSAADADDAFQAVFLVLARKGDSIRETATLGGFLHGVAHRIALKARAAFARRCKHEARAAVRDVAAAGEPTWSDVRVLLHEELARLSDRHRLPLVLCYLEGRTQEQAAALLEMSKGTLRRRLDAARTLLRNRLARRGVGSAALLLAAAWPAAASAVPPTLLRAAVQAGLAFAAGGAAAAGLSAGALALVEEGAPLAASVKLKLALAVVLVLGVVGAGAAFSLRRPDRWLSQRQEAPALAGVADKHSPPEKKRSQRTDAQGDPLPPRALARLGTQRFRSDGWVSRVAVVPGTKQLLGRGQRSVILWDAEGREVRRFEGPQWRQVNGTGYSVQVESFAVSPDGKTLAAATSDGSKLLCPILLFELATGKKLGELPGHKSTGWSACRCLAFVTPGLLASCGTDRTACVWDVLRKQEVCRLQAPESTSLFVLLPSPDGKHVFGAGRQGEEGVWLCWEAAGSKLVRRQGGLPGDFVTAALSPDGRTLAVSLGVGKIQEEGGYNELRLYSAPGWKEVRRWRTHEGSFPQRNAVAFAPDGLRLATGGADQKARQWDVRSGKEVAPAISTYPYANKVMYLDADTLLTFDSQSVVKFWSAKTGKPARDFPGAEGHLTTLAYSPDGRQVACAGGGGDATVRVWEVSSGKQIAHLQGGMADVTCACFSPDGKRIASASSDGVARVWDWASGREINTFRDHKPWLQCVAFRPDGKQLATGDEAGIVRVWDLESGKAAHTLPGHEAQLTALAFTPDGSALFSASWDHSIRRWDLATGKTTLTIKGIHSFSAGDTPVGHTNVVTGLVLSPGGHWLYSGSYDHRICVWETSTGRLCRMLKDQERTYSSVNAIALSADGTKLAAAIEGEGQGSSVHLWDVLSGKRGASLPGHRGKVTRVAFSPDGRRLASCSTDTTVLLWDVADLAGRPEKKAPPTLWEDLASADPATGYVTVCCGVLARDASVAVVAGRMKPLKAISKTRFAALIRQLDSDAFAEREEASRALAELGPGAEPLLREAARKAASAEVRVRVLRILGGLDADLRRSGRAVEMLEMIGTPQARRMLGELARGAAGAGLTRDAAAALGRLRGRR
jgi:RNA polymerase sigma factor (sigma-70 family)